MLRSSAVLLCLALPACASTRAPVADQPNPDELTLCVANESSSAGTIRVWIDEFRALTVGSGKRECRRLRDVSATPRLFAESMAGGFAGPTRYEGEIRSMGIRCWDWVLRDGAAGGIRLVPCDFGDGRRRDGGS